MAHVTFSLHLMVSLATEYGDTKGLTSFDVNTITQLSEMRFPADLKTGKVTLRKCLALKGYASWEQTLKLGESVIMCPSVSKKGDSPIVTHLFTCRFVRVMHLELVQSLDFADNVLAFQKESLRTGIPEKRPLETIAYNLWTALYIL
ncbi:unnamed protein product, partial [Meganyctiphanes norvegica]